MTSHSFGIWFNRSVVWLACAVLGAAGHAADRKPNVVLFMADDFGYEAVRLGDWKGYRTALRGPLQLHNLARDPIEQTDVAPQHRDIVTKIEAIMAAEHVPSPHWEPVETPQAAKKKSRNKEQ